MALALFCPRGIIELVWVGLATNVRKDEDMAYCDYIDVVLGYMTEDEYEEECSRCCGNCSHFCSVGREGDTEVGWCNLDNGQEQVAADECSSSHCR